MSLRDKLMARSQPGPEVRPGLGSCHVWTGYKNPYGYGEIWHNGRVQRAHRLSYEEYIGPIPDDLHVLHKCDNRACIRVGHLFLGTNKDNMADRDAKDRQAKGTRHGSHTKPERRAAGDKNGSRLHPERLARGQHNGSYTKPERRPRGERVGNSKLTEAQVLAIRSDFRPQRAIAVDYGVDQTLIGLIKRRAVWRHVP